MVKYKLLNKIPFNPTFDIDELSIKRDWYSLDAIKPSIEDVARYFNLNFNTDKIQPM